MKIILTGAPHSGKTTLLQELKRRDYQIVPEAAIIIITELNERFGLKGSEQWRIDNFHEYQILIAEKQLSLEEDVTDSGKPIFIDRGRVDNVGYCRFFNTAPQHHVEQLARIPRYH